MGGSKRKAEWLPWYRARNYKGNLTEDEKRHLDAFRMQPKHPAAAFDDLPEEVQSYISRLELDLYDKKQDGAVAQAFVVSAIGAGMLLLNYKTCFASPTIWTNLGGILLLISPWFVYRYRWHKNAEKFTPRDAPGRPTEEGIRLEWELNYIARVRKKG
jgi:hypothetical protein